MSEVPPGTLSLEDDAPPPPAPEPEAPPEPIAAAPVPDAREVEPEHLVEAPDGKRLNVGPIIAAERKRVAEQVRSEYEPFKQQAAQLAAEVQQLKQRLQPVPEPPKEPEITDEEAAAEARDLQLYTADSQLDLKAGKRIIEKRRKEILQVAEAVAQRSMAPVAKNQAKERAAQNFVSAVTAKDPDGQPLFATRQEQEAFATFWAEQPHELTADLKAAEVFLNAYVGQTYRHTKRTPAPPPRLAPVVSEAPGGVTAPAYVMTSLDKKFANAAGLTEKQYAEHTKTFQKDRTLVIGD